jgi:hypothetical protein
MSFGGWAALVTCLVSLALFGSLGRQYLERRRTYQLWWAISFLVAGVAALLQTVAFAAGSWPVDAYRAYIVFAAAVPGLMGAGTVFLLYRRWAPYFAGLIVALSLMTLWGALERVHGLGAYGVLDAAAQVTRTMPYWQVAWGFGLLGPLGAAALVLGAAWSWWRSKLAFNAGIVFGGIVFTVADSLTALGGSSAVLLFFLAEVVGSVALYLAVRAAGMRPSPASESRTPAAPRHA